MSPTFKQLAGAQRRSLRTMRQKLLNMADAWDGVDEFNRGELTDLADRVEGVSVNMIDDDIGDQS